MEPWALAQKQSLPLDMKCVVSGQRIKEWFDHWDGAVSVSISGGKDSLVLLHLVRSRYPDVPAVFCDTGLEYPEVRARALAISNLTVVKPKMSFRRVLEQYGYPVVSKEVSRFVWDLRRPLHLNPNTQHLRLTGMNRNGRYCPSMMLAKKWRYLVDAPFLISGRCCDVMKKGPLDRYRRETGTAPFVGMLASESTRRRRTYLRTGCNLYEGKHAISTPLAFWTEQDILQYLREHRIEIASVYGDIVETPGGDLGLSGVSRTGCVFCMFGVHMEKPPNRFQRLKESHPRLWRYCLDSLGLREVLEYIQVPYR